MGERTVGGFRVQMRDAFSLQICNTAKPEPKSLSDTLPGTKTLLLAFGEWRGLSLGL